MRPKKRTCAELNAYGSVSGSLLNLGSYTCFAPWSPMLMLVAMFLKMHACYYLRSDRRSTI